MQQQVLDERHPLLSIFSKPRETFRYMLDERAFSLSLYIGAIGGFSSGILDFVQGDYPESGRLTDVLYNAFTLGIIKFLLSTFILGYLLQIVGKRYGAQSTFKTVFQALCMATIPYIWLLPMLLFWLQLSPVTFFEVSLRDLQPLEKIYCIVGNIVTFIFVVWNFILVIIGLSEAMEVRKWRAFGVLCLTVVLLLLMVMLILFII